MSKAEYRNDADCAAMEQMSTAGLEELLLKDFHALGGGKTDMNGLYEAAQVLAQREPKSRADPNRAWERFLEQYLPFAKVRSARYEDGGTPSSDAAPERRPSSFRRWGPRGAVVAAALAILLLSVSAAAASAGGFHGLLALWTGERMWLASGQVAPAGLGEIHAPEHPEEYTDLREALEACGLTRSVAPTWFPDGFALDELVIDSQSNPGHIIFSALYCRDEENLVLLVDIFCDIEPDRNQSSSEFQKDEGAPVPYEAGGVTHLLTTNAGRPAAMWVNGPAECAFIGDITMEELEHMIDSIYE